MTREVIDNHQQCLPLDDVPLVVGSGCVVLAVGSGCVVPVVGSPCVRRRRSAARGRIGPHCSGPTGSARAPATA